MSVSFPTTRLIATNSGDFIVEILDLNTNVWKIQSLPTKSFEEALNSFTKKSQRDKSVIKGGIIICQA